MQQPICHEKTVVSCEVLEQEQNNIDVYTARNHVMLHLLMKKRKNVCIMSATWKKRLIKCNSPSDKKPLLSMLWRHQSNRKRQQAGSMLCFLFETMTYVYLRPFHSTSFLLEQQEQHRQIVSMQVDTKRLRKL